MMVEIDPQTWGTIVTMFTNKGIETNDPRRATLAIVRIERAKNDEYRQIELPSYSFLHSIH